MNVETGTVTAQIANSNISANVNKHTFRTVLRRSFSLFRNLRICDSRNNHEICDLRQRNEAKTCDLWTLKSVSLPTSGVDTELLKVRVHGYNIKDVSEQ
jgi:hypothetical protein